jgi:hypothetical protein
LLPAKTFITDLKHFAGELSNDNLETEDANPHSNEDLVGENSFERVKFIMDHTRAEHVNHLEHHKGSEEESEVAGSTTGVVALKRTCFR